MVNACSCGDYFTNLIGHDQGTNCYSFVKEEKLANLWIKFINRKDIENLSRRCL